VSHTSSSGPSRREVLKAAGAATAASALAGFVLPQVHAADDNTINVALVGCGGRGSGAVENALSVVRYGPVKLVAMADVFKDQLDGCFDGLKNKFSKQMDVPNDRKFIGFDAYKQAMDCLKPGDVAIFATPLAFRWVHFAYAVEKGLNVFMEKPLAADGPSCKKMFKLAQESEKKNMKVGVGLMCRHCVVRQELHDRIKDGQMGDIVLLRAYRLAGPTASAFSKPRAVQNPKDTELGYQIRRFHSFLWASGGAYSDFLIHNIDECSWMKDAFPIKARSSGGRHYRGDYVDQNFDTYSTEFTFEDGAKLMLEGRCISGCEQQFSSFAHGTKGSAIISWSGHFPSKARIFKGQNISLTGKDVVWKGPAEEPVPYQTEWDDLIAAVRQDRPYNEAKRGTEASLVTAMGRMAAHTGQVITREQMLNCPHEFAPGADKLTLESAAPVVADKDGKYPVPEPGKKKTREY
jgi:predicted dehydrogenase